MIHTVDDHPLCFPFYAKDDPVREADEMADLERELFLLGNQRTAFRHKPAKPTLCGVRLVFDITDEPHILLCVDQRRFCDVNLKCQASPAVPLRPFARG